LDLVASLRTSRFRAGDKIIKEGEVGDRVYIIESGECEVRQDVQGVIKTLGVLKKGDYFGEIGVLYDVPRSATVVAIANVLVLWLSRSDIYETLPEDKIEKMKVLARTQVFHSVPLLKPLSAKWKEAVASSFTVEHWQPDDMVFRENQRVSGKTRRLYLIEQGLCVRKQMVRGKPMDTTNKQASVFITEDKRLTPGSYFGMHEILYGCPHQFSVYAVSKTTTLSISYDELMDLFGEEADRQLVAMKRAVRLHLVIDILEQSNALPRKLDEERLERVLDSSETTYHKKWDIIFRKGERMSSVCMLESGTCVEYNFFMEDMLDNPDEHKFESIGCIEHFLPGDTFGTSKFIDAGGEAPLASFTLMAISECQVLHIRTQKLEELIVSRPESQFSGTVGA